MLEIISYIYTLTENSLGKERCNHFYLLWELCFKNGWANWMCLIAQLRGWVVLNLNVFTRYMGNRELH